MAAANADLPQSVIITQLKGLALWLDAKKIASDIAE